MKIKDISFVSVIDEGYMENKLGFDYNMFIGWTHKSLVVGFDRSIVVKDLNGFIILAKLIKKGLVEKVEIKNES